MEYWYYGIYSEIKKNKNATKIMNSNTVMLSKSTKTQKNTILLHLYEVYKQVKHVYG